MTNAGLGIVSPQERNKIKMNRVAKGVLTRLKELDQDKLEELLDLRVTIDDPETIEKLIKDEYLMLGREMNGDYYISAMALINSILYAGGYGRVYAWKTGADSELQIDTCKQ